MRPFLNVFAGVRSLTRRKLLFNYFFAFSVTEEMEKHLKFAFSILYFEHYLFMFVGWITVSLVCFWLDYCKFDLFLVGLSTVSLICFWIDDCKFVLFLDGQLYKFVLFLDG